jgi:hypothetical protein
MKKLLFSIRKKDFQIQTFRSGGPGGQHQNKVDSGVRIVHIESGAVGESRSSRSQHSNKKMALKRLIETATFKLWLNRKVFELQSGQTIDEKVESAMSPKNLKIEIQQDGQWVSGVRCQG